jgi:hypothetical protein
VSRRGSSYKKDARRLRKRKARARGLAGARHERRQGEAARKKARPWSRA